MDDMEFSKYSCEIDMVLDAVGDESLDKLVRNVTAYVVSENSNETNWLAHEFFVDVIDNEKIIEIFDMD